MPILITVMFDALKQQQKQQQQQQHLQIVIIIIIHLYSAVSLS